jgi:hypothetical protein
MRHPCRATVYRMATGHGGLTPDDADAHSDAGTRQLIS